MKPRINPRFKPKRRTTSNRAIQTDWNPVAGWYGKHLQSKDTYQSTLIFPKTVALLQPKRHQYYLDIACGEGSFAIQLAQKANSRVTGFDLAPDLVTQAKRKRTNTDTQFMIGDAQQFPAAVHERQYDGATCILAIQNIADYSAVFKEAAQALKPGASFVIVLNHPGFRPPKQSGWGFDEQRKLQYRRIDTYLTPYHVSLSAHPGKYESESTVSFHRPLQDYITGLVKAGFVITALEEWTSDRESLPGGRAKAENRSRQEFPLFMAIRAEKK